MELNVDKKIEFKDKLNSYYSKNKLKIYIVIIIVIFSIISVNLFNINKEKKNEFIAEKYIQAGLLLSSKNQEKSKKIYFVDSLGSNTFIPVTMLPMPRCCRLYLMSNKIKKNINHLKIIKKNNVDLSLTRN